MAAVSLKTRPVSGEYDHSTRMIYGRINICEKVARFYSKNNGRPSVDPVVFFKMLFIGYLFGIRSERQLMRETGVNVAYRWFLGYGLQSKVPHHSTISSNRTKRFAESDVYQEIFDEVVLLGLRHRLTGGKTLHTDSTHLKASANKNKCEVKQVSASTGDYLEDLEEDVTGHRRKRGQKPLKDRDGDSGPPDKQSKVSTTDPDSGYMIRDGKPKGFFYLDHRTVDGLHNPITDVHVTAGNVHDSRPYLARLDRQRQRFGFKVENVALDAGYNTAALCKGLHDRGIYGCMPYTRPGGQKGMLKKTQFIYDECYDCYLCPEEQVLGYSATGRDGMAQYKPDPCICRDCPRPGECTKSKAMVKVIARHAWEHYKEEVVSHRYEEKGKFIYKRRKEKIERSFAGAKELHGHRYARLRGKEKVRGQCLLSAAARNIKKIAILLSRGAGGSPFKHLEWFSTALGSSMCHLWNLCTSPRQLSRLFAG